MGKSRISINTPEGTKVLEGALRNALDSGRRIGDIDLPREGIVLPAVGGSDRAPENTTLSSMDWRKFCDELLPGTVVVVLSKEAPRRLGGGCPISRHLCSIG